MLKLYYRKNNIRRNIVTCVLTIKSCVTIYRSLP
nr:MAG TPA: hypothetical protein [Caudoviricetes sp.]DAV14670.1 MAG TPA: hypothetical protein [Caudoviricetes sp.]